MLNGVRNVFGWNNCVVGWCNYDINFFVLHFRLFVAAWTKDTYRLERMRQQCTALGIPSKGILQQTMWGDHRCNIRRNDIVVVSCRLVFTSTSIRQTTIKKKYSCRITGSECETGKTFRSQYFIISVEEETANTMKVNSHHFRSS